MAILYGTSWGIISGYMFSHVFTGRFKHVSPLNDPVMQDMFISRMTKTISQNKKLSRRQKRGWFTKEQMKSSLSWSASLANHTFNHYAVSVGLGAPFVQK